MKKSVFSMQFTRDPADPMDHWPLPFLLARQDEAALNVLTERMERFPDETLAEIARFKVTRLVRFLLQNSGRSIAKWEETFEIPAVQELSLAVQRKQALMEMNRFYGSSENKPILLKGAATSLLYYPKESLRWSSDIDLLLPLSQLRKSNREELEQLERREYPFSRFHLRRAAADWHFPVEVHFRAASLRTWGAAEDFYGTAEICPEAQSFLLPSHLHSLTILSLHLFKHRANFPYDLIDAQMLLQHTQPDWDAAMQLWLDRGFSAIMLAALRFISAIIGCIPEQVLSGLSGSLSATERAESEFLYSFLIAQKVTRLQAIRVQCLTHQISFARYCVSSFIGSCQTTSNMTGLTRNNPRFWFYHCCVLPYRRLQRLLNSQ